MIIDHLLAKLDSREAVVGIVGLGYVGLPLMLRFVETGYRVIGIDVDASKDSSLQSGQSYIERISAAAISTARDSGFEVWRSTAAGSWFLESPTRKMSTTCANRLRWN